MTNQVKIVIAQQGDAVCGEFGYCSIKHDNICAFYVDGWGKTGRIYAVCSSDTVFVDGKLLNYPSIVIEDGDSESDDTEIYFPEFEGWKVHSMNGGKTMSVCLIRE